VIEGALLGFEIYCADRRESIDIALSSVNILQYFFWCSCVFMATTSRTKEFREATAVVNIRSSNAWPVTKSRRVAESLWLEGMAFYDRVLFFV
jgi:hypothetical protein